MYLTPSRTWTVARRPPELIAAFANEWKKSSILEVVSHSPIIMNLASPVAQVRENSQRRLALEIEIASAFGVNCLVVHPGANPDKIEGQRLIIDSLSKAAIVAKHYGVKVLVENTAGQGSSLGATLGELAAILNGIEGDPQIGICLDTCHLFAAGYELTGYSGYERVISQVESQIDLKRIGAIHLNDSKHPLGSRRDRYASIGEGYIGLQTFMRLCATIASLVFQK